MTSRCKNKSKVEPFFVFLGLKEAELQEGYVVCMYIDDIDGGSIFNFGMTHYWSICLIDPLLLRLLQFSHQQSLHVYLFAILQYPLFSLSF